MELVLALVGGQALQRGRWQHGSGLQGGDQAQDFAPVFADDVGLDPAFNQRGQPEAQERLLQEQVGLAQQADYEPGIRVDHDDNGLRSYGNAIHRVTLRGLEPGTLFSYRTNTRAIHFRNAYDIRPGETLVSELGSFTTFDPNAREASFVVWNDTHNNKDTIGGLQRLSQHNRPDFVLLNGDVSDYIDDEADMIDLYVILVRPSTTSRRSMGLQIAVRQGCWC